MGGRSSWRKKIVDSDKRRSPVGGRSMVVEKNEQLWKLLSEIADYVFVVWRPDSEVEVLYHWF